jgi:subtilisin-like proprotein convertase family protein
MTRMTKMLTTLGALLALAGCAAMSPEDPSLKLEGEDALGKEDRWNNLSDPERFTGEHDYDLADLPLSGTAQLESWPSTYWPTYEDSINTRWNGTELSPAQKYDMAFNGWTPPAGFDALRPFDRDAPVPGTDWDRAYYDQQGPLASYISRQMGNGRDREAAITNNGRPTGEWPVETWWGLCHAWVPAALQEARPLRSVTHNGVTFHVGDLEALLIAAYNRAPAEMLGDRCNLGTGENTVMRDEYGRPTNIECADSNPGAMHVVVTNYLGIAHRGFAMDRTFDYEVWNQPVVGYEITRQRQISVADANRLLGRMGDTYAPNADAATLYDVHMSLRWITESHASTTPADAARYTRTDNLTYILEVDAAGKIIGGEWYGNSQSAHPDFLWNPRRLTSSSVPHLDLARVRMLVEMSRGTAMPPTGTGTTLTANGAGNIAIPDNQAAGISSAASIAGATGTVATVSVDLNITHPYIGDLSVVLEHNGVSRTIHNREGGSADNIVRTISVPGFTGADPNGTWTLRVSDTASADVGSLVSWRLNIGTGTGTVMPPPASTETRFAGATNVAIPDNNQTGASSQARVMGAPTSGARIAIDVNIQHPYVGDLVVEAVSPAGRTFALHSQTGGSDDNIVRVFPLDGTGTGFTGDPNGTWTLRVRDVAAQDVGTIQSWAVVVTR